MKVKKFVGELDNLNVQWTEEEYTPQIVGKDGTTYCISSVDFRKNSIVYLIAAKTNGMSGKEFDRQMTKVSLIRPNATIACTLSDHHHIKNVYAAWDGKVNFINIDIGDKVKDK